MAEYVLNARKRAISTKGTLNQLRKNGNVPGIYYLKGSEPISIEVMENEINSFVFTSETHIIKLKIENEKDLECIVKDVQFDPVTDKVVHFDLIGITRGQTIQVEVPVMVKGNAAGVKAGGKLQIDLHKLEIEVLPVNIPEHVEIDVTNLNVGESIHVRDLSFDKYTILNHGDLPVVSVTTIKAEVEEEEAEETEESEEPEVIKKGKQEEE